LIYIYIYIYIYLFFPSFPLQSSAVLNCSLHIDLSLRLQLFNQYWAYIFSVNYISLSPTWAPFLLMMTWRNRGAVRHQMSLSLSLSLHPTQTNHLSSVSVSFSPASRPEPSPRRREALQLHAAQLLGEPARGAEGHRRRVLPPLPAGQEVRRQLRLRNPGLDQRLRLRGEQEDAQAARGGSMRRGKVTRDLKWGNTGSTGGDDLWPRLGDHWRDSFLFADRQEVRKL